MDTKIPKLSHKGKLKHGYYIVACKNPKDGNYYVTLDLFFGKSQTYVISSDLKDCLGVSALQLCIDDDDLLSDHYNKELQREGFVQVSGCELSSVCAAFDRLCFADGFPMWQDEVQLHLTDLSMFSNFCSECCRRQKNGSVGRRFMNFKCLSTKAAADSKCCQREKQNCFMLWLSRRGESGINKPQAVPVGWVKKFKKAK